MSLHTGFISIRKYFSTPQRGIQDSQPGDELSSEETACFRRDEGSFFNGSCVYFQLS